MNLTFCVCMLRSDCIGANGGHPQQQNTEDLNSFSCPGFLLPWTWGISSRLLQQSAAAAPYMGISSLPLTTPAPRSRCSARLEYYSAVKKNAFELVLMRWMKLEPTIQSEVSQKEKHPNNILMHIYGIQKDGNGDHICEIAKRHRCKEWTFGLCGRMQGYDDLRELKHVYYHM